MNILLNLATTEICRYLGVMLPKLSSDAWWQKHVMDRLSFQQQRLASDKGYSTLSQLDLAALLRVLDQNWGELSSVTSAPREGRNRIRELMEVRNRWAHMGAQEPDPEDVYRDLDTLKRVLEIIGSSVENLSQINEERNKWLNRMSTGARPAPITPIAPTVSLHRFSVGQVVALTSDSTSRLPVLEILEGGGETRYVVFQGAKKVTLYESQLSPVDDETKSRPEVDAATLQTYLTGLSLKSPSSTQLFSLRSGRVHFVPYQYRPVFKMIRADRPRLLIADEVGVGKTIEAGLIIKELRARMDIDSILIICPKALVSEKKWFMEMRRFDETFTALDGNTLRHCFRETNLDGVWPDQYRQAILPSSLVDNSFLNGNVRKGRYHEPGLLELDPPPKFDLVIVDEAHHIRNANTYLHQAIRTICENAEAVVFLTATPIQLGNQDLYTLLNVLRPDLIIDRASFDMMSEPNPIINEAIRICREAAEGWPQQARLELGQLAATVWGRQFIIESPEFQNVYDLLNDNGLGDEQRLMIVRTLEGLYTFSNLINRTRRRDIGEFTTRKPETVRLKFTPNQQELHDRVLNAIANIVDRTQMVSNTKFFMSTIRRQIASSIHALAPLLKDILARQLNKIEDFGELDDEPRMEDSFLAVMLEEMAELIGLAESLDSHDPKMEAFVKIVSDKRRMPKSKSLLFSTFRHTLHYLATRCEKEGFRFGLIHGDVHDEERAQLRRRFALPASNPDAIDILLSSEVGCEGLDFQFCDLLINYDLPWNPMRIEQRIGRLDRYGQKSETIAIFNLITEGTVDAEIFDRCLTRIGVFQHAIGGSEEILGEVSQELRNIEESFRMSETERAARIQQLSDNAIRKVQEESELEAQQSQLFGLNVPNLNPDDELAKSGSTLLNPESLQAIVEGYLKSRLGEVGSYFMGEKAQKSLRLSAASRAILLEDSQLRKSARRDRDSDLRNWEKWLRGNVPNLAVTFDPEEAGENSTLTYLNVLHPLVRQAADHLSIEEPITCELKLNIPGVPPGRYPFAIYKWNRKGIKSEDQLIVISPNTIIENELLNRLASAKNSDDPAQISSEMEDQLEKRHHARWMTARAEYQAFNRELVNHRIQSLTTSHAARQKLLEDRIRTAEHEKILTMKQGELSRANLDYERRLAQLKKDGETGDIIATMVVIGVITLI